MNACDIKVSVVIPVYNNEKYLNNTIECILNQTFENYELICVDDGSTDGTLGILKEYESKDSRIKVLKQDHKFAGVARNYGLSEATGDYVMFLDGDDIFDKDLILKMVESAAKNDSDVVICKGMTFNSTTGAEQVKDNYLRTRYVKDYECFSIENIPERIFSITNPAPWNKLFKKSFIEDKGIKFQDLQNTNNLYFSMCALALSSKISWVDEALVKYRIGDGGNIQSTKEKYPDCFTKALIAVYDRMTEEGIFENEKVLRSFVNFALSVCVFSLGFYNESRAKEQVLRALNSPEFLKMGITDHEEDFYDDLMNKYQVEGTKDALAVLEKQSKYQNDFVGYGEAGDDAAKVSVIIPVYNVENYLAECLDSVLAQTLTDIEILCVDDGSTDKSGDILKEYEAKDSRVRIINKPNGGLSSARNKGLLEAKGRYIFFLDSDDYIAEDTLEVLYEKASGDDLDIVCFDAEPFYEDEKSSEYMDDRPDFLKEDKTKYTRKREYPGVYTGIELMSQMEVVRDYRPSVCLQMFSRAFIWEKGYRFYEGIVHEDNLFSFCAWLNAKKAGCVNRAFYFRRYRSDSIMTQQYHFSHVYGYFVSYIYMQKELMMHEMDDESNKLITAVVSRTIHNSRNIFMEIPRNEQYAYVGLPSWQMIMFKDLVFNECAAKFRLKDTKKKLEKSFEDKSELNRKLKQTYEEKSEINRKLQQTYKEKAERGVQLKEYREREQQLNDEIAALHGELAELRGRFLVRVDNKLRKK